MRTRGRRAAGLLVAAALVAPLSGCLSGMTGDAGAPSQAPTSPASPMPQPSDPALARFYDQQLQWAPCDGFDCAALEVPVNYQDPGGQTLEIAVVRRPARGDSRGALVVNPGGPGSSGVAYARAADVVVSDQVRESYDVVGFDPRGVGQSAPVDCASDAEFDALIAADATPDAPAEVAELKRVSAILDCTAPVPGLLDHLSTFDAARDLDVLRAALGQPRLDYLGVSYGTHLGATYAALFPGNVGRFVLDGPLPADLDAEELARGQAQGFEDAVRRFVEYCQSAGECPLGDGPNAQAGMDRLGEILAGLDATPASTDDQDRPLTEAAATYAILLSLYRVSDRPLLRDALASLVSGDGTPLQRMMDERVGREADGRYRDNSLDAFYAISCRDRAILRDIASSTDDFTDVAPLLGEYLAWGNLPCVGTTTVDQVPVVADVPVVLVVATTHDPATPFIWAEQFTGQFTDAVLLVREGDGHTGYREGSECVDDAVDAFLLDGALPESGTTCD